MHFTFTGTDTLPDDDNLLRTKHVGVFLCTVKPA